ncbi:probable cell surface protein (LPXTG motif) [Flavobacteriales bacterium ALC-1]|nr:probable cell surface protein (LPXTG motif) [Flavobacteriales bacterium ALC-1]
MKLKLLFVLLFLLPLISLGQCPPDSTFNSQAEIDAFAIDYPNCNTLASLVISGDDINDLTPMSNLVNVETLSISNNPLLANLNGLHNIETVISLSIINNDQLTNLDELSSLSSLGIENLTSFPYNSFIIRDNESLENISMLSNTMINYIEIIRIQDNPSLLSLNGFESLEWSYVLIITNNDELTNLMGLENLSIGSDFLIEDNDGLIDLQGLGSYTSDVSFISLNNNSSLISLNGLNTNANFSGFQITNNISLADISQLSFDDYVESFNLSGNLSLSVCNVEAICNILASDNLNINFSDISNNAEGCNDFWQVTESCQIPPVNDDVDCGYYSVTPRLILGETAAGLNSFATTSTFVPSCNNIDNVEDVWYYFYGNTGSVIDLEVTNGFSLQLWQLSADSCEYPDNIFNIAHVPNACGTNSLQDISLPETTVYFVQVWDNTSGRNTDINEFEIILQDATLSNNGYDLESLKIFPNPVSNVLQVDSNDNIDVTIEIFSALGQKVLSSTTNKIDLSILSSGIYYLNIISNNRRVIRRIIKD